MLKIVLIVIIVIALLIVCPCAVISSKMSRIEEQYPTFLGK